MDYTEKSGNEAKVMFDKDGEEPGYSVEMTITPDCMGFEIRITSDIAMDENSIVDVLEDFLYQNILNGYSPTHTNRQ